MFASVLIWAFAFFPFLHAMPQKRCSNALQNPSFESGVYPWLEMGFGSWSTRGIYTSSTGGHDGHNFYYGQSNATKAVSSMSVSQSGFSVDAGTTVECSAWLASSRPGNVENTEIQVFLDGISCGSPVYLGTTGWVKVGGKITVPAADMHTFTVVAISGETGPQGSQVWIDNAMVGTGC